MPEGDINITFYAQDRAGNIGTESISVEKALPTTQGIQSYNLFILFGIISISVILITREIRSKFKK